MIVDIILKGALVGFSVLHASDYYNRKGPVWYVLTFYNQYIYGELSILLLFILFQDTPAYVCFLILYFDLCEILHFIMFCLSSSRNLCYLKFWNSSFTIFSNTILCCRQINPQPTIFDHPKHSVNTARWIPIGGWMIVVREIATQI